MIALREAAEAAGGRVIAPHALPEAARFSTDTRTLVPGDVYVALRGATFDGHAFALEALACGASALVVDDERVVPPGVPALIVDDTTHAYLAFAGVARRRLRARVVAVTGSAGKTTTKEFIARVLEHVQSGRVVATPANENNEIGVAKVFLRAPDDAAFVVVEFGARHYGEIAPLARVALPEVGVITNIGDAHLEIFGSYERLAHTKWGIFATGARAVLGADSPAREPSGDGRSPGPASRTYFAAVPAQNAQRAYEDAGRRGGEPRDGDASVTLVGRERLEIAARGEAAVQCFATHVAVAGAHNLRNVAAAAAAAHALGFAGTSIARALADLALPAGRYERIALGDAALIYDGYNASMHGALATLESFAREPASRRIVVLGSMAELGPDSPAMHARVGEAAARAACAYVLVGGEFAADLARGAGTAGIEAARIVPFASNGEAVAWLGSHLRAGDLVLLKASRRYRFEEIVDGLRAARANGEPIDA